jgi:CPA2 family monovalent cation:H+ antiporter-2
LGAAIAYAFGWTTPTGLVFGIALSVASTVVLVRVLTDFRDLHTRAGHIAVGWLVVEDLFTVIALVLLPVLVGSGGTAASLAFALTTTLLKVAALVAFTAVVGRRVLPMLLDRVAVTGSRELFTLTVLVIALGIAFGSALLFGVSMALGAFLAGMVVGRSDYSLRAASEALPMRDAFAVLFFVSVGMLLDPGSLLDAPGLLLATLGVVMIGKPLIALAIVRMMGYPFRTALSVSVALAQIGEFSFILSSLGRDLGVLDALASNTIVAVSIVSIMANPLIYRLIVPVERWAMRHPRLWRLVNPDGGAGDDAPRAAPKTDASHRAILVGYGPTGRTLARLLTENGIEPTIVDLNIDTVRSIRDEGMPAVYGDASRPETLESAGITHAGTLILASAGMEQAEAVIRTARGINPRIYVLARSAYLRDVPVLEGAGADKVYSGEGEVALAFTETMLERLGATPEQLDRERDRAHDELFGTPKTI